MPLLYIYEFHYEPPKEPVEGLEFSVPPPSGSKFMYGESEKEARKKFKKYFGVEAGELLSRQRW